MLYCQIISYPVSCNALLNLKYFYLFCILVLYAIKSGYELATVFLRLLEKCNKNYHQHNQVGEIYEGP